ncbi:hypothetical protein ALC57_17512 [Trachymyrmex cornetzi]|uniref:Uncharacterized protein n=1 Tax=Trachymyrmex cornetzi TaxID=471704 RepID=A0A195DBM8_9HYME|nr:hypothetical protein ALC57_17512 [Trachymyrmex cornetzi]
MRAALSHFSPCSPPSSSFRAQSRKVPMCTTGGTCVVPACSTGGLHAGRSEKEMREEYGINPEGTAEEGVRAEETKATPYDHPSTPSLLSHPSIRPILLSVD